MKLVELSCTLGKILEHSIRWILKRANPWPPQEVTVLNTREPSSLHPLGSKKVHRKQRTKNGQEWGQGKVREGVKISTELPTLSLSNLKRNGMVLWSVNMFAPKTHMVKSNPQVVILRGSYTPRGPS